MKSWMKFSALVLFFTVWFSVLIPWDRMPDPDALYHITMARQTLSQGPVTLFPWLDLTSLGTHFADQHFLLHVLQIPFLSFFDPLTASRVSSVFFAVIALLGIAAVFYFLQIRLFWLWPILLAVTQPFCTRMVQGKASPLAVLFWIVGIAFFVKFIHDPPKRKVFAFFIFGLLGLLFTLTHGGWIILPGSFVLIFISAYFFRLDPLIHATHRAQRELTSQLVNHDSRDTKHETRFSFHRLSFGLFGFFSALFIGIGIGLVLHPGRAELFELLKIQVLRIGVATPWFLHMGMEWSPATLAEAIGMTSVFGIVLLLCVPGLIMALRKPLDVLRMRQILALGLLAAVLFALSIKSVRFAEYFQPLLALWTALLASLVDWKQLIREIRIGEGRFARMLFPVTISIAFFAILANNIFTAYASLHDSTRFMDGQYCETLKVIAEQAGPGDRVYHSSWDEFPALFFLNQDLHYVSGLDPTFLYEASTTLALDYQDFIYQTASTTPDFFWQFVHDRIDAKFLLIDRGRWPKLNDLVAADPRYQLILQTDDSAAYAVR